MAPAEYVELAARDERDGMIILVRFKADQSVSMHTCSLWTTGTQSDALLRKRSVMRITEDHQHTMQLVTSHGTFYLEGDRTVPASLELVAYDGHALTVFAPYEYDATAFHQHLHFRMRTDRSGLDAALAEVLDLCTYDRLARTPRPLATALRRLRTHHIALTAASNNGSPPGCVPA